MARFHVFNGARPILPMASRRAKWKDDRRLRGGLRVQVGMSRREGIEAIKNFAPGAEIVSDEPRTQA